MDRSHHVHLGPYLLCKRRTVAKERTFRSCQLPSCKGYKGYQHSGFKFCPHCGGLICEWREMANVQVKGEFLVEDTRLSGLELIEDTDRCMPEDVDVFIPCVARGEMREPFVWGHDSILPINSSMIDAEMKAFRQCFRDEIVFLIEQYGSEHVTWHWGMLNWLF